MRKVILGAVLGMVAGTAMAQGPYVGGKVAWVNVDDVLGISFDSAMNGGVVLGYEFLPDYGLAAEAEFTTSINDGDWSYLGVSGNWDIQTSAIYLVSRLGQEVYAKVKVGYLNEDISVTVPGLTVSGDDSGVSWGLGGGYKFTQNVSAEVEWTKIEADADAWSAGVNFSF